MYRDTRSWFHDQIKGLLVVGVVSIALGLGVNAFRSNGIPWVEDWDSRMINRTLPEGITGISFEEAQHLFESGSALFLDARDPEIFLEERVEGALNLPVNQFQTTFPDLADRLSEAALIVTYCGEASCHQSEELAQQLLLQGFSNVLVFLEGLRVWKEKNQPIETGPA